MFNNCNKIWKYLWFLLVTKSPKLPMLLESVTTFIIERNAKSNKEIIFPIQVHIYPEFYPWMLWISESYLGSESLREKKPFFIIISSKTCFLQSSPTFPLIWLLSRLNRKQLSFNYTTSGWSGRNQYQDIEKAILLLCTTALMKNTLTESLLLNS